MKRIAIILAAFALACAPASAQNILQRLGNRAKNAIENNVGGKVEKGINDILNGNTGNNQQNQKNQNNQQQAQPQQHQHDHAAEGWTCPECGHFNTGAFCTECGTKKPAATASQTQPKQQSQSKAAAETVSQAVRSVAPGAVPNPYTEFDIPDNPFDVPLGLPENDKSGERPAMVKPASRVSYAAYTFPDIGASGKEFWNAERQRMYSVSYEIFNGERLVHKMLAIVDSMAIYMIDDAQKLITKIPVSSVQALAMHNVVSKETVLNENEISTSQGRWCYAHSGATESTLEFAGHQTTETNGETTYTDLETGITLEVTHGFSHDYTRNIHLGLYYPEIYDLPAGYRMIVQDFTAGMQKIDEMEENWKSFEEQVQGMDLGNMKNKSTEELLQMLGK